MPDEPAIVIRAATVDDAAFIAWIAQEADRGHVGIGSLDVIFDIAEERRLEILERLAVSDVDSYLRFERFLIATVDGVRLAALSGYVPSELAAGSFEAAARHELAALGWRREAIDELLGRTRYFSSGFFSVPIPRDTLRVEWVATRPESRGLGLNRRLHETLFKQAQRRGLRTAHVGTYIGNEPALKAYRRAGFEEFAEARHADFEAIYRSPGLVFLRRDL